LSSSYRPEIDGLRAVAVVPVIFFHAQIFGFTGGFVGVDVFFVISGFLITGLIQNEIMEGKFTYFSFWERRARRLLPPLVVVTVVSLIAGAYLLLPNEFKNFGQSVVASTAFSSNIYFWLKAGYFAAPADMVPLLHTWSLAVEEQFYVLFPAVLLLCASLTRKRLQRVIIGIGILSLMTSIWLVAHAPDSAYYLLPSRAWELMLGSFLALTPRSGTFRGSTTDLLILTGSAAIIVPMVMYSEHTPFPGWAALVPCAGTAMIVWATERPSGVLVKALAHPAMLQVGRMSYSLYLWHWPMLVLGAAWYNKYIPELDGLQISVILACTAIGSWLSLVLVENPIRYRQVLSSQKAIFTATGIAFALLAGTGLVIHLTQGIPSRVPDEVRAIADARFQGICEFSTATGDLLQESDLCQFGSEPAHARLRVVLFGDSHASHLIEALHQAGINTRTHIHAITRGGCPPLLGFEMASHELANGCPAHNEAAIRLIGSLRVDAVVVAGYWSVYAREHSTNFQDPADFTGSAGRRFSAALGNTLRQINATGATVVLVNEGPRPSGRFSPARYATAVWHGSPPLPGVRRDEYLEDISRFDELLRELEVQPAQRVRHENYLCGADFCPAVEGTNSLFTDDNHLSAFGSRKLIPAFEAAFHASSPRVIRVADQRTRRASP